MFVTLLANRFIWKLAGLYERLFFTLSWVWTVFSFSLCLANRKYIIKIIFCSYIDVWDKILEPVACVRKNSEMLQLFPAYLRGEDLFGLTVSAVARIAESVSVLVTAWSSMLSVSLGDFLLSRIDPFSWGNGCGLLIGDLSSLRGVVHVITSCWFTWLKGYPWYIFPLFINFLDSLLLLSKGRVVPESSRLQQHWLVSSLNVGRFGNESM